MLGQKGRIEFEIDVLEWANTALEASGIRLCQITPRKLFKAHDYLVMSMAILSTDYLSQLLLKKTWSLLPATKKYWIIPRKILFLLLIPLELWVRAQ